MAFPVIIELLANMKSQIEHPLYFPPLIDFFFPPCYERPHPSFASQCSSTIFHLTGEKKLSGTLKVGSPEMIVIADVRVKPIKVGSELLKEFAARGREQLRLLSCLCSFPLRISHTSFS